MMISCHVLTASVIATKIKNPGLAMAAAFAAHFAVDTIPHFGNMPFFEMDSPWFSLIILIDGIITITILTVLCKVALKHKDKLLAMRFLLCAFAASLPDLLYEFRHILPKDWWFYQFHSQVQWFQEPVGIFIEIAYAACMIYLLKTILANTNTYTEQESL